MVPAGSSYGAYLQTKVYQRLLSEGKSALPLVLVSPGVGLTQSGLAYTPDLVAAHSLILLCQRDESGTLDDMGIWAARCGTPVVVQPGADHFYNRKLPYLAAIVTDHLERMLAPPPGEGLS